MTLQSCQEGKPVHDSQQKTQVSNYAKWSKNASLHATGPSEMWACEISQQVKCKLQLPALSAFHR